MQTDLTQAMKSLPQEPDVYNQMRWDGRSRGHHESWILTLSQANTGAGFRIRYALLVPERGEITVQVSLASFVPGRTNTNVAIARTFPVEHLSWTNEPFWLEMGPCSIEPGRMTGMLDGGGAVAFWDLLYQGVTDPLLNLPKGLYRSQARPWLILTPYPFMLIGGKIQIGDHQFMLNGDPGQQEHFWGSRYPVEWIWFHCSSFLEESGEPVPAYIAGVTMQDLIFGRFMRRPESFGHLVWREKHIALNPATPWQDRRQGRWQWKGLLGHEHVTAILSLLFQEAVLEEYRDPSWRPSYCHHSEIADCSLQFQASGQPARSYRSRGMAYAEIGSFRADSQTPRRLAF